MACARRPKTQRTLVLAVLLLGGSQTASAFTTLDRAACWSAWTNAFYFTSNGRGYFRDREGSGTVQYFWQFGSDMEVVNRAEKYCTVPLPSLSLKYPRPL